MKKALSALLAFLMFASVFAAAACSEQTAAENNQGNAETSLETTVEEETTELTRANTPDDLPVTDLNNQAFNILCRTKSWFLYEMDVDELTGEVVNDAVYDRNLAVQERFNCVLNYVKKDDVTGTANNSINAGSDDYQIVVGSAVDIVQYGARGMYYNLLGDYVPCLNLEQPWWAHYYTEQATVGGKCFFITGDAALSLTQLSFVTFFNKNMVASYGLENPYELVRDGAWTIDKQIEMTSSVYVDVNGNSKADKDDVYGFGTGNCINYDVYWSAFDLTVIARDENNLPYLSADIDKMSSAIEKIANYFTKNDTTLYLTSYNNDSEQNDLAKKFAVDELLMTTLRLMACDILRDMEADYGIIPAPKWDEAQEYYYTFVHDQYSVFGIPSTTSDPEHTSLILEAIAAENYRYVIPAYYDIALNGKYLRDIESSEMLEIALANVKIDFSWIYTYNMNSIAQNGFRYLITGGSTDFASYYAKSEKVINKLLNKLINSYDTIDS